MKTRNDFLELKTTADIANLVEISHSKLVYYLYKYKKEKYVNFSIKKKSGGTREINAPIGPLLYIQRKLLDALYVAYSPRPSTQGGVPSKSIVTNASKHTKSQFVINFDLLDFFPTIHFGRVRGMLMANPYNLPGKVATVVANICCYEGKLPQGSPTSPIIANMVCHRMDRDLQKLSINHGFYYTRYFDDITLSTKRKAIPNVISYRLDSENRPYVLGKELLAIIKNNGFSINDKKTRIRTKLESQAVTGIKVNRFLNLDRKFIRQVRAMLHAWERYGHDKAQIEFIQRYDRKHRASDTPEFRRVVKGKIDYIKMVRGDKNDIYKKMLKKYRILETRDFEGSALYKKPVHSEEQLIASVFVIEYEWELNGNYDCAQGTAFALDSYGFITCAHILPPNNAVIQKAEAWRSDHISEKYTIEVISSNRDIDLAILSINASVEQPLIKAERLTFLGHDSKIVVAGFPNYKIGDELYLSSGHVTQRTRVSGIDRYIVSVAIVAGNSGGPVLNENNQVVGVAATGFSGSLQYGATHYHSFIPISALEYLPTT